MRFGLIAKKTITDSSIMLNLTAPTCTHHKCTNMTVNINLIYYKHAIISIQYQCSIYQYQSSFNLALKLKRHHFFNGTNQQHLLEQCCYSTLLCSDLTMYSGGAGFTQPASVGQMQLQCCSKEQRKRKHQRSRFEF